MSQNKKFNIKFFSDPSTLIETVDPDIIVDDVRFDSRANGGLGQASIKLTLPFDDFATHVGFINVQNFAKISEIDENNKSGRQIFVGYVSKYTPILSAEGEFVEVILLGLASLLSESLWGTAPTFLNSYTTTEPSVIARDIIDDVNSIFGSWISYSTSGPGQTVFDVGTNITYDFEGLTHIEAMEKLIELTEGGWFWHVDGQGNFRFQEKAATADHAFQIGVDIQLLEIETNIEELYNDVTVKWSSGTVNATDATSITNFGRREILIEDSAIKDATSAQQRADRELAEFKDPKQKTTLVLNNKFDIESIRSGQTCKVRGLKSGSTVLDDNLHILGFDYNIDTMTLELEERKTFAGEVAKV